MKTKRVHIVSGIVALALIIYAVISLISINSLTEKAENKKADLESQVQQATEQNAELKYNIEHSDDDETKKDIAREKLGLVMPGEIIFYDESN